MSNKDGGDNHPGVRGGGGGLPGRVSVSEGGCELQSASRWSDLMFGEQLGNLWVREGCAAATFALQSWLPKTEETDGKSHAVKTEYK